VLGDVSWNVVRRMIETGKVRVDELQVTESTRTVHAGERLTLSMNAPRSKPRLLPEGAIVFVDAQVVVVEKPSGIATVPFEESERDTLDVLVAELVNRGAQSRPRPLHVVHRIDKETSGLLVFARTPHALRHLKNQFRFHNVARRYLALAHGNVTSRTIKSRLITDRGDGRRGSTSSQEIGREAITHVRAVERFGDATLVECRLETGRTHQIRIHLSEEGHPLLGERVYSKGYTGTLLPAPRILLHAAELGFVHPSSEQPMHFDSEPPADFTQAVAALRARSSSSRTR
jgi:23S rRNA pseudouridine1911/1915/1917 synthase